MKTVNRFFLDFIKKAKFFALAILILLSNSNIYGLVKKASTNKAESRAEVSKKIGSTSPDYFVFEAGSIYSTDIILNDAEERAESNEDHLGSFNLESIRREAIVYHLFHVPPLSQKSLQFLFHSLYLIYGVLKI